MELTKIFSRLAEQTDTWGDIGHNMFFYKKPIRIRTTDDISLIGQQLARYAGATPYVEFLYEGEPKTPEEISKLPNTPKATLDISSYINDPNVASNGLGPMDYLARCTFAAYEAKGRIGPGCSMFIHVRAELRPETDRLTVDIVKNIVESSTETVGPRERNKPYSVINRITQATEEQRRHDRSLRRQSAWISFGVSLGVAVVSAVLTFLFTSGK